MAAEDLVYRLSNLYFTLLHEHRRRDLEWIREHVPGYPRESSRASLQRMLDRDVEALRGMGVRIDTDGGYQILEDPTELNPVEFSAAEATVLGNVGHLAMTGEINHHAQRAWTKLAAGGAQRDLGTKGAVRVANEVDFSDPDLIRVLSGCIHLRQRISFDYEPLPHKPVQRRIMDPWAIVLWSGRTYLVGWDRERDDARAFRLANIADVRKNRSPGAVTAPDREPIDVVRGSIERGEPINARLRIHGGLPQALAAKACGPAEDGIVEIRAQRDWIVRQCLFWAHDVELLEPADARAHVLSIAKELL